jgi:predicted nucleic acid-binding protein
MMDFLVNKWMQTFVLIKVKKEIKDKNKRCIYFVFFILPFSRIQDIKDKKEKSRDKDDNFFIKIPEALTKPYMISLMSGV